MPGLSRNPYFNLEPRREPQFKRVFMHLDFVIKNDLCEQFFSGGALIPMPSTLKELDDLREKESLRIREDFDAPYYNPMNTDLGGAPWGYIFMIDKGKFSTGLTYLHPGNMDTWREIRIDNNGENYYDHL